MACLDWTYAQCTTLKECPENKKYISRLKKELPVLPFLSLPFAEALRTKLEEYEPYLQSFRHMLLLGIGGSALGPRALQKAFASGQDRPEYRGRSIWIADNVHPEWLKDHLEKLPAKDTLVVVISKSGGTIETIGQYLLVLPWLKKMLPQNWQDHLFMITDEKKGFLREEADTNGIRTLPVPDNLGGRYSVLSAVGLVPAAFLGMDWKNLLQGALDIGRPLANDPDSLLGHPAWRLAQWAYDMSLKGKSQVIFFCYIPEWSTFGPWFCQLWAESLGKDGKGTMPLPATGVTDQHSLLQMFLDGPSDKICMYISTQAENAILQMPNNLTGKWEFLRGHSFGDILKAEAIATRARFAQKNIPTVHFDMDDNSEYSAGKLIMLLEAATIFTGWLMDINPVDQPAVEDGKRLAMAFLGAPGYEDDGKKLQAFLSQAAVTEQW